MSRTVGVLDRNLSRWEQLVPASRFVHISGDSAETADVLLADGADGSTVARLRALRPRLPHAQPIIVAEDVRKQELEREITLSPGIGEVWIVTPDQVSEQLLERAASIAKQRALYARQRAATLPAQPQAARARQPVVTDAFLATILQVAQVGVISLDEELRILSVNPAAERLFGILETNSVGKPVLEALQAIDHEIFKRALSQSQAHQDRIRFHVGDALVRSFDLDIAEIKNFSGTLKVLVAHDTTESTRQRELLEEQALELEHQNEQVEEQAARLEDLLQERDKAIADVQRLMESRSRFYAAMNHEIRTPINAILGFNDLMLAGVFGELPAKLHESVERSQRAAEHLLELVNDVLDLSKIEAGRVAIELSSESLDNLIRDLIQTVEPTIISFGSTIELELNCAEPISTDARRVRQILMNLVSNAAKFGAGKPITIRCSMVGEKAARIDVIDRGVGIPPEQMEHIFDEFVQLRERRQEGTGLGLAISRRLAEMLGGRIEVESEAGKGSTFSLTLHDQCEN